MNRLPVVVSMVIAITTLAMAPPSQGQVLDCVCDSQFAAGDRVIALVDDPGSGWNLPAGSTGTVVCGFDWAQGDEVWIRWDNYSDGVPVADCECEEADAVKDNSYWGAFCNEIEIDPLIECACSAEYSVGDRIVALVGQPSNAQNLEIGTGGTVLCGDGLSPGLVIRWDNWSEGGGISELCTCQYVEDDTSQWYAGCFEVAPPTSPFTVDDDGPADFTTIQAAIDYAANGEEILVYPGTYTAVDSSPVAYVSGKSLVLRSLESGQAIIEGNGGYCIAVDNALNPPATRIEGFHIMNGNSTFGSGNGAGINLSNAGDVEVVDCEISDCNAINNGGGLYASNTTVTVTGSTIRYCDAKNGGGIAVTNNATLNVSNSTIIWNEATLGAGILMDDDTGGNVNSTDILNNFAVTGGGVFLDGHAEPIFTGCLIRGNAATRGGGILCSSDLAPAFIDCEISENSASKTNAGGGIKGTWTNMVLDNCVVRGNMAGYGGGAYFLSGDNGKTSPSPTITNSNFTGNFAIGEGGGMMSLTCHELTLQDCNFSGNSAVTGGGLLISGSVCNTIDRCLFEDNWAAVGGGVHFTVLGDEDCATEFSLCDFINNSANQSGGMFANTWDDGVPSEEPLLTLISCNFQYNNTLDESYGGGIYCERINVEILYGTYTGNTSGYGGAISCSESTIEITLADFNANQAAHSGGGIYIEDTTGLLFECTFDENSAERGGGTFYSRSNFGTHSSAFTGNTALYGGGMYQLDDDGNQMTSGCTFTNNVAGQFGGALMNEGRGTPLVNCELENNTADEGAGIYNMNTLGGGVYGTLISGNTARNGGGVYNLNSTSFLVQGCIVRGNGAVYWQEPETGRGGAMCNESSDIIIETTEISDNSASWGGGICNLPGSILSLDQSTVANNIGKISGGGIYSVLSLTSLLDTAFCGNAPTHVVGAWDDEGGNTFEDECPDDPGVCVGDTNEDYNVDVLDLLYILAVWGTDNPAGDINDDGIVDVNDVLDVIANWGLCS